MPAALSTDLEREGAIPYFLWDEPMTVAELRERLASASQPERLRLLGKLLREARDTDVWRFTTPRAVREALPQVLPFLGQRRGFWVYLLDRWQAQGLL